MGSKKPCHGCGEIDERRAANSVCWECHEVLRDNPKLVKQLESLQSWERVQPRVGWREANEVQEMLNRLYNALPKDACGYSLGPQGFDEVVRLLHIDIDNHAKLREARGHAKGCDLLKRLADGDTSVTDFEFYRESAQRS